VTVAVNDRTLRIVLELRRAIDRRVDDTTAALALAWDRAWVEIASEFQAAADEIVDMIEDGEYPTRGQILRSQRAANAVKAAVESVRELSRVANLRIGGDLDSIIATAERWQRQIAASQLPYQYGINWARVDHRAIQAIVKRSTGRIEAKTRPLPRLTQERMKSALVRGVAVGDNPRTTARLIVNRCRGEFQGGLYRARTIARTELLDASRRASDESRKANKRVLAGWRWHASLDPRTCPSCLAMNGEMFDADMPGPDDHPNGRCTAVPITKSWADLGIDLDEPADEFPDARAWFDRQTPAVQRQIMGQRRLDALNRGEIGWSDLAVRRENPGWRPSYQVAPLPQR
jgi:SPP1 gp7 family putative phage head morphogenesis protein